jgi:phosphoribosyl 1,2-cyclic phosphodiesterase
MLFPDEGDPPAGNLTVRFWGVRGSYPTPDPAMMRYGGNTPCVQVNCGGQLFFIDAGTGFIKAGDALVGKLPKQLNVLFSHLHHDHVSGFPFFRPGLSGHCAIRTFCGNLGGDSAKEALDRMFSPPLFPVGLDALPARYEHVGFKAGTLLSLGDVHISTCPLFHPGGATGYRFDHGGRRVCYISDIEHTDPWPARHLVHFCSGADLVIFDCMYTNHEYAGCRGWGHSTWRAGYTLCKAASAKAMAGFHHNPTHDDDKLDALEVELAALLPTSFMAREGQTVTFSPKKALVTVGSL